MTNRYQAELSSKESVRGGDSLGRIRLKEKVGFQLFVELRGRQGKERIVGLSTEATLKNEYADAWVVNSREQELGRRICQ